MTTPVIISQCALRVSPGIYFIKQMKRERVYLKIVISANVVCELQRQETSSSIISQPWGVYVPLGTRDINGMLHFEINRFSLGFVKGTHNSTNKTLAPVQELALSADSCRA